MSTDQNEGSVTPEEEVETLVNHPAPEATSEDAESAAPSDGDAPSEEAATKATAEATESAAPSDGAPEEAKADAAEAPEGAKAEAVEAAPPAEKHPPTDEPFLVVTALVDSGVRAATATMSHGDAMERALAAAEGVDLNGVDLVELSISPAPFGALRKALSLSDDTVALYDVFPLASHLSGEVRRVAGQFLAAEAVWTLEDQGLLGGVPLNARLDLPKGWERDPKAVHSRLMASDALNLSEKGIEAFKRVKTAWDESAPA